MPMTAAMSTSVPISALRQTSGRVLAALAAVLLLLAGQPATSAEATTNIHGVRLNTYEARLVQLVNDARRSHGLRPLTVAAGTTDVARRWAWRQASAGRMFHNPDLRAELQRSGSNNWSWYAENVGYGSASKPDALFQAYMNSSGHRANILDPRARFLGMGVVVKPVDGGRWAAYNTMNFVNAYNDGYGATRVPALGTTLDSRLVTATHYLAQFEKGVDQRVTVAKSGGATFGTAPQHDRPTAADNAVRWSVRATRGTSGYVDFRFREPLNLARARAIEVSISGVTPTGKPVPVQVLAGRQWVSTVRLGEVRATGGKKRYVLTLPDGARTFRDTITLRVHGKHLANVSGSAADRRVRLSVFAIRVIV